MYVCMCVCIYIYIYVIVFVSIVIVMFIFDLLFSLHHHFHLFSFGSFVFFRPCSIFLSYTLFSANVIVHCSFLYFTCVVRGLLLVSCCYTCMYVFEFMLFRCCFITCLFIFMPLRVYFAYVSYLLCLTGSQM